MFDWFKKKDKDTMPSSIREEWESCAPDMNVVPDPVPPREWAPSEFGVKIMIAGDLQDVRHMSNSVMKVQQELQQQFKKDFPKTNLLFSVGTFLDECRHDTDWSSNPADIGSVTTRWHCYQTDTMFHEALNDMRKDPQSAGIIILVGERFDDNLEATKAAAKALLDERGTRIFALSGKEGKTPNAYTQVAESGGGAAFPRLTYDGYEHDSTELVQEITQTVFCKLSGKDLAALPAPASPAAEKVRALLEYTINK